MHPWLLYGETVQVATYPAVIVAAFIACTAVLRREALRSGLAVRDVMDAALVGIVLGGVCARALHVLVEAPAIYAQDPWRVLSPFAGWTFYGGLLGGLAGVALVSRYRGLNTWRMLDVFALAVPFGQCLARLGCLAAGCCYGRLATWPFGVDVPWAVVHHDHGTVPEALLAVPLHPAALYLSLMNLGVFVLLARYRGTQPVAGRVFVAFLMLYSVGRGLIEVTRGDVARGLWFGGWVSTSQLVSLLVIVGAAWVYTRLPRGPG